jgi:hypothetical protein
LTEPRRKDDRLFVRDGRRSYRRRYSRTEARWGMVVLAGLCAVLGWVLWKGAHPDPELFSAGLGTESDVVASDGTSPSAIGRSVGSEASGVGASGASAGAAGAASAAGNALARAPFPSDLAAAGWREGAIAHYDHTNLYEKIDGREDYYKSFGFERLHWVSLSAEGTPESTVDIELFDQGTAANALGAYAGERPPEIVPQVEAGGMWHRARNAAFATSGRYYARIVGADESPAVLAQVEHARRALAAALPAEPLPWGYALFTGGMGIDPGRVAYVTENAFSLGFARRVYTARLDDADLEAFVVATPDDAAARALAERFIAGFLEYGTDGGKSGGVAWVRDRNVDTFATATASDTWVVGVRGAPNPTRGAAALGDVRKAVAKLPAAAVQRARQEAASSEAPPPAPEPASAAPQS